MIATNQPREYLSTSPARTHAPSGNPDLPIFYAKSLFFALLPLTLLLLATAIIFIDFKLERRANVKLLKESQQRAQSFFWNSTAVVLFLLHSVVSTHAFMLFACKSLDQAEEQLFLVADMALQCYTASHTRWMLLLGLPQIVFFVFGVPIATAVVVMRDKRKIQKASDVAEAQQAAREEAKEAARAAGIEDRDDRMEEKSQNPVSPKSMGRTPRSMEQAHGSPTPYSRSRYSRSRASRVRFSSGLRSVSRRQLIRCFAVRSQKRFCPVDPALPPLVASIVQLTLQLHLSAPVVFILGV